MEQSELAASYLMYNRVLLELLALILLPVYSITLAKWGPKLLLISDFTFLIIGGFGYIACFSYIYKKVLDYVLLSTILRSFSAMHGVFYISASILWKAVI